MLRTSEEETVEEHRKISYGAAAFLRSFAVRMLINIATVLVLYNEMQTALSALGTFDLNIGRDTQSGRRSAEVFSLAEYVFGETAILITLAGLMAVTVIAILTILGFFEIKAGEERAIFRARLLVYSIAHLLCALALTTYLMMCVGFLIQTNSNRINESSAFIWAYPTYALVVVLYLVELYGFLTRNSDQMWRTAVRAVEVAQEATPQD
jgi:hypothetical protein